MRNTLSLCVLGLVLVAGCKPKNQPVYLDFPEMVFSSQWLDFGGVEHGDTATRSITIQNTGELALGVVAIYEGEGAQEEFSFEGAQGDITCPDGAEDDSGEEADAKDHGHDDTGDTGDSGDNESDVIEIGAGCRLTITASFSPHSSIGAVYGSIIVETATEDVESAEPAYFADLDQTRAIIYLQGDGMRGQGIALVSPRFVDFGHVWTGIEEVRQVEVTNAGDGDLVLGEATLSESCDEAVSINWAYEEGTIIEGGTATMLEVTFLPVDQYSAFCTLNVNSDDPDNPEVAVNLQGNSGSDPENEAPRINIYEPEPGHQHMSGDPLILKISVSDVNQPADSLVCRVRSEVLQPSTVAMCTPSDESGYVEVEIDVNDFPVGADTLVATVTDASEVASAASVSVLIRDVYPDSDDDGDGYGDGGSPEDDNYDCDDAESTVYPQAAERNDGLDNDCDTLVDEGTAAGDDDGDTFNEYAGDCDDNDSNSYPGAPEVADHADNNCNGLVDEGTTLYDDDGDGYAEIHNDCDDTDASVNPGQVEICDGIDNNCNGLMDQQDGCLEIDTDPVIVGGIHMSRTACEEEETIQLSVLVWDADSQSPTYTWSVAADGGSIDDPTAAEVSWTAPELSSGSEGALYSVYAVAQDPDGNQVWDFDEVGVYPRGQLNGQFYVRMVLAEQTGMCSSAPAPTAAWLALVGAVFGLLRRRRD